MQYALHICCTADKQLNKRAKVVYRNTSELFMVDSRIKTDCFGLNNYADILLVFVKND